MKTQEKPNVSSDIRNIVLFLFISYGFTWLVWLPGLLATQGMLGDIPWPPLFGIGACGPLVAALWLIHREGGWEAVRAWLRAGFFKRFKPTWWLVILTAPFLAPLLALWLNRILGGSNARLAVLENPILVLPTLLLMLTIGGAQEEYGWRGYLLPRLDRGLKKWQSDFLMILLHACWHVPLFYIAFTFQYHYPFWLFLVFGMGLTPLINLIYRRTGGSILAALVFHGLVNTGLDIFPAVGPAVEDSPLPVLIIAGMFGLLAFILRWALTPPKGSSTKEKTVLTKKIPLTIIVLLVSITFSACHMPVPAEPEMPDPAAQFCQARGYAYEIRTDSGGNQYGVCVFSPGDECESWAYYRGECAPQADPTQPPAPPTELPVPTETAAPEFKTYRDDTFRIELQYPADWNIHISGLGEYSPQSNLVNLSQGKWILSIHIKMIGDSTIFGGGLGAGDIQPLDTITVLGSSVHGNALNYENKIKSIWYGIKTPDLEIYAKLIDSSQGDYRAILISEEIAQDVKDILESMVRTGAPLPTPQPTPFFAPTQTTVPVGCSMNAQLVVGSQAQITPGLPNTLRSAPGRESDSQVIGSIPGGGIIDVLDGPVCKSGYNWWKVEYGSLVGWTAEGINGTYWVLTYQSSGDDEVADSEEVDGWVGVVVSADDLPQVDDYFQMMDQNGSRYGIHSLDREINDALVSYRDTGKVIKVWGILYRGRKDAYNSLIEVTRLEEF